jgi:pilus assembly protein CpaE
MFSVYVVARPELRDQILTITNTVDGAFVLGHQANLRQALADCQQDAPGLMVLDDEILQQNLSLVAQLSQVTYPIVLIGRGDNFETARRALAIHARDLVDVTQVAQLLGGSMARHAVGVTQEAHAGRIFTVFSSKGGVGKTTISVNLAIALAQLSHRPVALVDLDLQFGDVMALLGEQSPNSIHDLVHVPIIDQVTVERAMTPMGTTGVRVLAAPNGPQYAEDVPAQIVLETLNVLKEHYQFVVVDTAPGFSEVNVAALDLADQVLTVVTPEVITVRSVKQALDLFAGGLNYSRQKVRLIMNRAGTQSTLASNDVASVLGVTLYAELPSDWTWAVRAANQGQALMLFQPAAPLAQGIRTLARQLMEETEGPRRSVKERSAAQRRSFLEKLLSRPKGGAAGVAKG